MQKYEFDAIILRHEKVESGYIEFPYDGEKEFGKKGQIKVKAWFNGFLYRGSLVKMGFKCHWIGLNKEVRNAIGKTMGDKIHIVIEEDRDERAVTVPPELSVAFEAHPQAKLIFDKVSYTHKKEYVQYLTEAKKEETREKRLAKIINMLLEPNRKKKN